MQTTPESYLGYHYGEPNLAAESVIPDAMSAYTAPSSLPQDEFAFGGQWDVGSEAASAGAGATLALHFQADDVYLVLGGAGTIQVALDGRPTRTVDGVRRAQALPAGRPGSVPAGTLTLDVPAGVQAYDFTFG